MDGRRINLVGEVFGRLTVTRFARATPSGCLWLCLCACGNTLEVRTGKLRCGDYVSCGCYRLEQMRAHVESRRVWVVDGKRPCSRCKRDLPVEDFYRLARASSKRQPHCKRCHRDYELQKKYGITRVEYDTILAAQGGHCAVCPATEGLDVDHCHKRGKVRGILCGPHNRALGLLQDDLLCIAKLYHYVEKANEGQKMSA